MSVENLKINFPLIILNDDGTELNYPKNPLEEKWDKLYPPTKNGEHCEPVLGYLEDGRPIMNYSCVLCREEKCRYSNNWKVPKEDEEVWNEYLEKCKEYYNMHNTNSI